MADERWINKAPGKKKKREEEKQAAKTEPAQAPQPAPDQPAPEPVPQPTPSPAPAAEAPKPEPAAPQATVSPTSGQKRGPVSREGHIKIGQAHALRETKYEVKETSPLDKLPENREGQREEIEQKNKDAGYMGATLNDWSTSGKQVEVDTSTIADEIHLAYFVSTLKDDASKASVIADWAEKKGVKAQNAAAAVEQVLGVYGGKAFDEGQSIYSAELWGYDNQPVNLNYASPAEAARAVKADPNKDRREKNAEMLIAESKRPGSRFYGMVFDEDELKEYNDTAALPKALYDEFVETTEAVFDPTPGHEAQNEEEYQRLMDSVENGDYTDYQKHYLRMEVEMAYASQLGYTHAKGAAEADAQAAQESGGELFAPEPLTDETRYSGNVAGGSGGGSYDAPDSIPTGADRYAGMGPVQAMIEGTSEEIAPIEETQTLAAGSVNLASDPIAAVTDYVWTNRGNELDEQTRSAVNEIAQSSTAAKVVMGLDYTGSEEIYEQAQDDPFALARANSARFDYIAGNRSTVIGGTLGGYLTQIEDDSFPAAIRNSARGAVMQIGMDAEAAYMRGEFTYDTARGNMYDAYIAQNPMARDTLRGVFRTVDEIRREERRQAQLSADVMAKAEAEKLAYSRAAMQTESYTQADYDRVLANSPTVTTQNARTDATYNRIMQDIRTDRNLSSGSIDGWYNEKTADYLMAAGLGGDLNTAAAENYKDMLLEWVEAEALNDVRIARSLGYDDVEAYYARQGGFDMGNLYDRAAVSIQRFGESLTKDDIDAMESLYRGSGETSGLDAFGAGVMQGVINVAGEALEAIWMMGAAANEDRPSAVANVRNSYIQKYGAAIASYAYTQDMLKWADSGYLPNAEMGQHIKDYIASGEDVFQMGLMPVTSGIILQGAVKADRAVEALSEWAYANLNENQGKVFEVTSSTTSNLGMQAMATALTQATGSGLVGVGATFGMIGAYPQEMREQLADGRSLKQANALAATHAATTALAEMNTSNAFTDKMMGALGVTSAINNGAALAGKAGTTKTFAGMAKAFGKGALKGSAEMAVGELVTDEFKDQVFWNIAGSGMEAAMDGATVMEAIGTGLANADTGEVVQNIIGDIPASFVYMSPTIFLGGFGEGFSMSRRYAAELAATGSPDAAKKFGKALGAEIQGPKQKAEINQKFDEIAKGERAAAILATDEEIRQTVVSAAEAKEQADSHAAELEASEARKESAQAHYKERKEAGDIPGAVRSAHEIAKAQQGINEHTRERDQKQEESSRLFGEAANAAMQRASAEVNAEKRAMLQSFVQMAEEIRQGTQEQSDMRLAQEIAGLENELVSAYESGADEGTINDILGRMGALAGYQDTIAQERAQANAGEGEQVEQAIIRRANEIEEAEAARLEPEQTAISEAQSERMAYETEQEALRPVFGTLRDRKVYVNKSQEAEILAATGFKSLSRVNKSMGLNLTSKEGTDAIPLDGGFYTDLKAQAPEYFREEWDTHPEEAIVALANRRKNLAQGIRDAKTAEMEANEALKTKRSQKAPPPPKDVPEGYALDQFANETIRRGDVATDEAKDLLQGSMHKIDHDEELMKKGREIIANNGLETVFMGLLSKKASEWDNQDAATAYAVADMFKNRGNGVKQSMILMKMNSAFSKSGKMLRMAKQFAKNEARNAGADTLKIADNYNRKHGKKGILAQAAQAEEMDYEASLGSTNNQPFMENAVAMATSEPGTAKLASDVYQRSGLNVYWARLSDGFRGYIDHETGSIVINQAVGASEGAKVVAIHELVHDIEHQKGYDEFADAMLKAAYGEGEQANRSRQEDEALIRDEYAARGKELTPETLRYELVAAATEKIVMGDENFMRQIISRNGAGLAAKVLNKIDTFLSTRQAKQEGQEALDRYNLIRDARARLSDALRGGARERAIEREYQAAIQVETSVDSEGLGRYGAQQRISDPETYDAIEAEMPEGDYEMRETEGRQENLFAADRGTLGEQVERVRRNIETLERGTSRDNKWGLPLNEFQMQKIRERGLENVPLAGDLYNRATTKQRMLHAILATPQDYRGEGLMTLTEQLDALQSGREAVVTEADLNFILAQAAIVEGSETDDKGIPLLDEGKRAYTRMKEAQGNIIPVTFGEKLSAWRYMSMLSSPVTTIKNVGGNMLMTQADEIAKASVGWLDELIAKRTGTRTVSAATRAERRAGNEAFAKKSRDVYDQYFVSKAGTARNKNYDQSGRGRVFENEALETGRNVINFLMDGFDQNFMEKAYVQEVAALERIGYKVVDEDSGELRKATQEEIAERAWAIAEERYFHNSNAAAQALQGLYEIPYAGKALRVLIPFSKTPTNVASRMLDYSPAGLAKSLLIDGLLASKRADGSFDQQKFVMGVGRGLTGTGMFAAGIALYNAGILKFGRGDEEDKKRAEVKKTMGEPYGMYIEIGGTMHEIDWMNPACAALAVGAGFMDRIGNKDTALNIAGGVVQDTWDQLFEASYLSAINDLFSGYKDSGQFIASTISSTAKSYAQQMFAPSLVRAAARWSDPYVRDTKSSSDVRQFLAENIVQYWPGLRQTLPIKADLTGEKMTQRKAYQEGGAWENAALHFIDSFFTPTATYSAKDDEALYELLDLSYRLDSIGENGSSVLPTQFIADKSFELTVNKTTAKSNKANRQYDEQTGKYEYQSFSIELTDEEKRALNAEYGDLLFNGSGNAYYRKANGISTSVEGLRAIMNSPKWKRMTDEERAEAVTQEAKKVKDLLYTKVISDRKEAGEI